MLKAPSSDMPRTAFNDTTPSQSGQHARAIIALHWISVVAVVVAAGAALARDLFEQDAIRNVLLDIHRQSGLVVLLALVLRLAARARFGMTDHAVNMSKLLRWAAVAAHLTLYALLAAITLLGLATSHAHAVPVKLFGIVPLPMLAPEDSDLADLLSDWHVWVAWGLLAVVVTHVAAALWHHRVRRDGVLAAMAPWVRRR